MSSDLRLIEDYLPIEAISAEASREKSVRKGHISTLHLWWARRPLVACRAAVYSALVPADRWVKDVDVKIPSADAVKAEAVASGKKKGLNRKAAKEFVTKLCRYPKTDPTKPSDIKLKRDTEAAIVDAQKHILEAHAERLSIELADARTSGRPPAWVEEYKFKGGAVTYADIVAGRAPRPRVLDMFAGGGAIPLEALRLGCEAYALDLNPVAHIIQLCTLVYPQRYGKPDPAARGMTGAKNGKGETTWGGLANEVRYWGNWVLDRARGEIGDLYPLIPDPEFKAGKGSVGKAHELTGKQSTMYLADEEDDCDAAPSVVVPTGYLMPVAYLWTRTVRCKNPACAATVPLVKQTWLCKKEDRYVALDMVPRKDGKEVRFEVVESVTEKGLGFDPEAFSKRGNATCPFCGTVADSDYVKAEGIARGFGSQLMAVACVRSGRAGKVYLSADDLADIGPPQAVIESKLARLVTAAAPIPNEPIEQRMTGGICIPYGLDNFGKLFTPRQTVTLLALCKVIRSAGDDISILSSEEHAKAVRTVLGLALSKLTDFCSSLCTFNYTGGRGVKNTFGRQALQMVWDFAETNPFNPDGASWIAVMEDTPVTLKQLPQGLAGHVVRGSATSLPMETESLDAVVTDPPYYDNIDYAKLADFFYVWQKRCLGDLYPEHFSGSATPKKQEAVADPVRHGGSRSAAKEAYEGMMSSVFREASRVLKRSGSMTVVYAHKTTMGWSTLVDALRTAGFTVSEAWPLDTEKPGRLVAQETAALASSIFLVARKREADAGVGNYEDDVQPELGQIVRERVETLWDMGITGADLVIACVGAGLRAFTRYEKVEYANGEEVPAERFLAEVEGVVLDTMLGKLSGVVGGNVSAVDNASRFYVLWRFVYKVVELDAGEAIIFANGTHIELDGPQGLSAGTDALVEKKKAKYRARDFTERGNDGKLGLPVENNRPAPLIDALHRILWLMENSPRKLNEFLDEARPDRERLRALAQALAGAALSGKSEEEAAKLVTTTPAEQAAIGKLLANWRSLIESRLAAEDKTLFGKQGR